MRLNVIQRVKHHNIQHAFLEWIMIYTNTQNLCSSLLLWSLSLWCWTARKGFLIYLRTPYTIANLPTSELPSRKVYKTWACTLNSTGNAVIRSIWTVPMLKRAVSLTKQRIQSVICKPIYSIWPGLKRPQYWNERIYLCIDRMKVFRWHLNEYMDKFSCETKTSTIPHWKGSPEKSFRCISVTYMYYIYIFGCHIYIFIGLSATSINIRIYESLTVQKGSDSVFKVPNLKEIQSGF